MVHLSSPITFHISVKYNYTCFGDGTRPLPYHFIVKYNYDISEMLIEMLCLFAIGAQRNEREDTKISITRGRSPGLSQQRM